MLKKEWERDGTEVDFFLPLFSCVQLDAPLQLLVTNLDYDEHKGRIAIGRVQSGTIRKGDSIVFTKPGAPACRPHPAHPIFRQLDPEAAWVVARSPFRLPACCLPALPIAGTPASHMQCLVPPCSALPSRRREAPDRSHLRAVCV